MERRDEIVSTPTEILQTLERQQLKQHIVYDAEGREFLIFEAPIDAKDGEPCLVTEYRYSGPSSTRITGHQERQYRWKAAWDAPFLFDPTIDYDADGDGEL